MLKIRLNDFRAYFLQLNAEEIYIIGYYAYKCY
jgi:hypothetical protein